MRPCLLPQRIMRWTCCCPRPAGCFRPVVPALESGSPYTPKGWMPQSGGLLLADQPQEGSSSALGSLRSQMDAQLLEAPVLLRMELRLLCK